MAEQYSTDSRALMADELLRHPLLIEAFQALHQAYVLAARKCDQKDDIGRYRYAVAQDVIDGVQSHLRTVIAHAKLTQRQSQEFQSDTLPKRITRLF